MFGISRRRFLQLSSVPLFLPRRVLAAQGDRKFIFVFCNGGWDPTWGFAPMYDASGVDSNPDGEVASVGDIQYVASQDAPFIGEFFTTYADRLAIIHGFEVRSITHERCKRLLLTGKSSSTADDWPAQIAGNSSGYLLPHVVVSGPSFTSQYTASVVRLGETGQFGRLLSGSALTGCDPAYEPLGDTTAAAVERFRTTRAKMYAEQAGLGRERTVADSLVAANANLAEVRQIDDLDLSTELTGGGGGIAAMTPALDALERGYARSVIMSHGGQFNVGWDTHADAETQTANFDTLFMDIGSLMQELDTRAGTNGGTLADETTVVLFSEMGRAPVINATGGKDHWTFTSAIFIGAGVQGGRVVGGYDQDLCGKSIDLESGEESANGTLLSSSHVGATILALAGLEGEADPITAILS